MPTLERREQALLATTSLAAAAGLLGGVAMPRGPVTSPQAVLTVVACVLLGAVAGWWGSSRWALLLTPAAFAAAYELARLRVDGPTLDTPQLDGLYGVLVLLVGRGVDALLTVPPMLVGAGVALFLVDRRHRAGGSSTGLPRGSVLSRAGRAAAHGGLAAGVLLVVGLVAGLARPSGTEPVQDAAGTAVAGSVAELVSVAVGGHEQHLMIRGQDAQAPVLLFLEGGPGGSALGRMRRSAEPLEQHFVVATWDQRGTGKSYSALEPTSTLTLRQMTSDTLEVIDHLRQRFDEDRVYVVGSSWGSIIGVLAAQERPEVFHALVGTGQMVDPFATDLLMYAENLAQAERTGDNARAERLRAMGTPPYTDPLAYLDALAGNPEWTSFPHGPDYDPRSEYPMAYFVGEYTLIEQLRGMASLAETYVVLYPQLEDVDLRTDAPALQVPVYLVQGAHEADGRTVLAREWFDLLRAPDKRWITLESSGHTPPYDEPGSFAEVLADLVLTDTARAADAGPDD